MDCVAAANKFDTPDATPIIAAAEDLRCTSEGAKLSPSLGAALTMVLGSIVVALDNNGGASVVGAG